MIILNWKIELPLFITLFLLWITNHHVAFWIIISLTIIFIWLITYLIYFLLIKSGQILHAASRMKTGNDLAEQFETVRKIKTINYFKFLWVYFIKGGK